MTIKANAGENIEVFVKRSVLNGEAGKFEFNNFVFELKGEEGVKDYHLILSQYHLNRAMSF